MSLDKYVVQTVTQIEHIPQPDGTERHRLIRAFSTIIGEPKKKTKKEAKQLTSYADEDIVM